MLATCSTCIENESLTSASCKWRHYANDYLELVQHQCEFECQSEEQKSCAFTPSSSPTRYPTGQPSSRPTSSPTNPTGQPTSQPSTQPTSRPTGLCPAGYYFNYCEDGYHHGIECDKCSPCLPGYYSNFGSVGSESCIMCALGKFSTKEGSSECLLAPSGATVSSYGATTFTLCAQSTYSAGTGEVGCIPCPNGRLTVSTGSKREKDCVSPQWNFYQGFLGVGVMFAIGWQYVLRARFERVAFLRKGRVVRVLGDTTRQLTSMYMLYAQTQIGYQVRARGMDVNTALYYGWGKSVEVKYIPIGSFILNFSV